MIRRIPPVSLALLLALSVPAAHADSTSTTSAAAKARPPVCTAPEYHQFDFWIGDWNVETAEGQPAGTNRIERMLDGCVLLENWTGAKGGAGKSFNLYDATDRKWHQIWVDNSGGRLTLEGGLANGRMVLSGAGQASNGATVINRITWTPIDANRVEQHWEVSADNGTSWTTAFWGLYKRKGAGPPAKK